MKSSQTTLIPPEGHCQNNKQLGFFKESYQSWTGEGFVCCCLDVPAFCTFVLEISPCYISMFFFKHTGRFTFHTSFLLFWADPPGRRQSPLHVLLSTGGHLDSHLHRDGPSSQLQWPGPGRDAEAHDSTSLARFGEWPQPVSRTPAQASLVLDENQDIAKREIALALAAGQQIVLLGSCPPRAGGRRLRRQRSDPWIMVRFCRGKKQRKCFFFFLPYKT